MRYIIDGVKKCLILRKPPLRDAACGGSSGQGGCLEGRTALTQPIVNSFTASEEPARRSANAAAGPERGYARLRRHEILQADRGSDFDFLRKHPLGKVLR
jgi:hypothetical protein